VKSQFAQEDAEYITKSRMVLFSSIFSFLDSIPGKESEEIEKQIEQILEFSI